MLAIYQYGQGFELRTSKEKLRPVFRAGLERRADDLATLPALLTELTVRIPQPS